MESFVSLSAVAASLSTVPPKAEKPLPRFALDYQAELDLDPRGPGAFVGRNARAKTRAERISALDRFALSGGFDPSTEADPLGIQLSRAMWLAQLLRDPQRKYVPPKAEQHPMALCAADLPLVDRMNRRVALDRAGRIRGARQDLADARSALLRARERNDPQDIETALVWEAQALDALRYQRIAVVESARTGKTVADLSMAEEAVLHELCQDPPTSTERERELARLTAEQTREAKREKIAFQRAEDVEPDVSVPTGIELEGSNAEALAAES